MLANQWEVITSRIVIAFVANGFCLSVSFLFFFALLKMFYSFLTFPHGLQSQGLLIYQYFDVLSSRQASISAHAMCVGWFLCLLVIIEMVFGWLFFCWWLMLFVIVFLLFIIIVIVVRLLVFCTCCFCCCCCYYCC